MAAGQLMQLVRLVRAAEWPVVGGELAAAGPIGAAGVGAASLAMVATMVRRTALACLRTRRARSRALLVHVAGSARPRALVGVHVVVVMVAVRGRREVVGVG